MVSAPYYITLDEVKSRLYGKVKFSTPPNILTESFQEINATSPVGDNNYPSGDVFIAQDQSGVTYDPYSRENKRPNRGLSDSLLGSMIAKAEAQVAHDFSPFYVLPLESDKGDSWNKMLTMPEFNYQVQWFKNAFIVQACLEVCKFEFGRNSNVNGEGIIQFLESEYKGFMDKLYKMVKDRYFFPPLPHIKITGYVQYQNQGYPTPRIARGRLNNSLGYAERHMNNPSMNWFTPWSNWPAGFDYGYN